MAVPVSWGSTRAASVEVGAMRLMEAHFSPDLSLPPHEHDRPTIALVLAGGFDGAIGGRDHDCAAQTMRSEPAGERHSNRFGALGAHIVVVQPDPLGALPRAIVKALDEVTHVRAPFVTTLGRAVAVELARPDDVSSLALEGLALEIIATAARMFGRPAEPSAPWVGRATELVHERFRERLRIEDIASAVGAPPSRLARAFRAKHGMPLASYVRQLRLEWAAGQLARTSDPISAIAIEAGFADQPHLTRSFVAQRGVTPRRYRELSRL